MKKKEKRKRKEKKKEEKKKEKKKNERKRNGKCEFFLFDVCLVFACIKEEKWRENEFFL